MWLLWQLKVSIDLKREKWKLAIFFFWSNRRYLNSIFAEMFIE